MQPEEQIDQAIMLVMSTMGQDVVDDIQYEIDILYPPASLPGDPPHRRTGLLHDGIEATVVQSGPLTTLTVVSTAPYSIYLENGTERMRARPFMMPALEKWEPLIVARFVEVFNRNNVLI